MRFSSSTSKSNRRPLAQGHWAPCTESTEHTRIIISPRSWSQQTSFMRLKYLTRTSEAEERPNMRPEQADAEKAASPAIECISAVSLATHDMACSVRFYQAIGFTIRYGGETVH
jgi:hypothetical protein